jgi:hypothetical protein
MAIGTFGTLKSELIDFANRTDLTTAQQEYFVQLVENDIRTDVRVRAMETIVNATMSGETLGAPTGFLEMRQFLLGTAPQRYVTPDAYEQYKANGSTENIFTIKGDNILVLQGTNGDMYSLLFWKAFASMSTAADTNWLLTNHPMIYLYGAMVHLSIFMKDPSSVAMFAGLYQTAVLKVMGRDKESRISGPLQMRSTSVE